MAFVAPLLIGSLAPTAVIGSAFLASGIAAALLRVGGSLLLSAVSKRSVKKPSMAGITNRTVSVRAPAQARDLVYGRVRKGGVIVFMHTGVQPPEVFFAPQMTLAASDYAANGTIPASLTKISLAARVYGQPMAVAVGGAYATPVLVDALTNAVIGTPVTGYQAPTLRGGLGVFFGFEMLPTAPTEAEQVGRRNLYLVLALAAHRVKSIGAIYFDGELAIDAAGAVQPRWAGFVRVEKALGEADQSAFPLMRQDLPALWTERHRMRGVAGISLRLTFNNDAFPGGLPNISCDVEGKDDILDPRTGLRGWSENPALCVADYMALPTDYSVGAAIGAADGIDAEDLIEAANICDEAVPKLGGGAEPRYTCNGVVSLEDAPQGIIETMLSAMAGRVAYQAGVWRVRAGAYRIPTVTVTGDEARGPLKLTTRISRSENFNAVRGTFVSPENDYQPDDFPAVLSEVYLAEDKGERRFRDIVLPFTNSASMAQRLAKIELERARRQMTVRYPGMLSAWRASVSETVGLTHARWGFAAKPFEVFGLTSELVQGDGAGEAPLLVPDLVLRETSPLIYDWSATEEQIYAAAPRTTLPNAFDIAAPGGLSVREALYVTRDGTQVKAAVTLSWSASASPYVAQYQIEARVQGSAIWQSFGRTTDLFYELPDWTPGQWEFRVAAVTVLGVFSPWVMTSAEIYGLGAPPLALDNLTIQTAGGIAILKWTRSSDPDVRIGGNIVIRHSGDVTPSWQNSYSMDRVSGNEAIAIVPLKPGTYLLRAEDSSGQLGPVSMVATKGATAVPFVPVAFLQADTEFNGTFTDAAALIDGALSLGGDDLIDDWPAIDDVDDWDFFGGVGLQGVFTFAAGMDFGSVRRIRLRSDIALSGLPVLDRIDTRTTDIDDWSDFDAAGGAEVDVVVEYRETDNDPAGSPTWSNWSRVDSSEIEARAVQARAILSTRDPAFTPQVTRLRVYADEVM